MFDKVLIANRGEIARRILRTCRRLGIGTVAVYSEADATAPHVLEADQAVLLGSPSVAESYLNTDRLLQAARDSGAQAIHPGYGFLSESAEFVEACTAAGLVFIGPSADVMRKLARKHESRRLAQDAGVPIVPGSELLEDVEAALRAADGLGYPVMLKCTGGGGGIGMQVCTCPERLRESFPVAARFGASYFNDSGVYLEKAILRPRHIEVQIFGDSHGHVVALGERECSIQRRHQKVLEEAGSPYIMQRPALRAALQKAAARLGQAVSYTNAGTIEFLIDDATGEFYFLEVNTRLQVEHPVTEATLGVDLVEWMLRVAAGEALPPLPASRGHAIEVRLYAEDHNGRPSVGLLTEVRFPQHQGLRYDTWVETGTEITSHYDPLLAKIIAHGQDRAEAKARLSGALAACSIGGIPTNLDVLRHVVETPAFLAGDTTTLFLEQHPFTPHAIEVVDAGVYTTVQDFPGRTGYWAIGVSPSGPMDGLAHRIANSLVGNDARAATLEVTLGKLRLRCLREAVVAVTGAEVKVHVNGQLAEMWASVVVPAGGLLDLKRSVTSGCRTYVAVRGGIDVPLYLGSRATFPVAQLGGLQGGPLRSGSLLPIGESSARPAASLALSRDSIPVYETRWEIGVLYGPHGAPDFFTVEDIRAFFAADWGVHHNSSRLGIRLLGPRPRWARSDGGEAGLHPSNLHDCEYAIGTINYTGDMPIVLTCDGPSLGGFVCPATIVQAEMWKIGQVKPGDTIRFRRMTYEEAGEAEDAQTRFLADIGTAPVPRPRQTSSRTSTQFPDAVVHRIPASGRQPQVEYRLCGDRHLLIEYGPMILDLALRFRVHGLMEWMEQNPIPGVLELSPGVRSLQIHWDSERLKLPALLNHLLRGEEALGDHELCAVPSRIVRLPMSFGDRWTREAIERYMRSVRATAPYLPSNIDFIARINGLASAEEVRRTVFDCTYLVLGLGDVYLGAPCAVPLDPRHRLITSKYNPARTYTPEGGVGIGGAYMCIYGMNSPGGYQLIGRTLPIWDRFVRNRSSADGKPWLLRFFDQVRFYPVSDEELIDLRARYSTGRMEADIQSIEFDVVAYNAFLASIESETCAFLEHRAVAFAEERQRWAAQGMLGDAGGGPDQPSHRFEKVGAEAPEAAMPPGCVPVRSPASGAVWDVMSQVGAAVAAEQPLLVVESMKMELPVTAGSAGVLRELRVKKGDAVSAGDIVCVVKLAS